MLFASFCFYLDLYIFFFKIYIFQKKLSSRRLDYGWVFQEQGSLVLDKYRNEEFKFINYIVRLFHILI